MYSEKINMLIEMAIADGVLSEQEKRVLFKNAQEEGIDLDEFEMVINAKLFEKQKELKKSNLPNPNSTLKSNKYGDTKKCPQCGHVINGVEAVCPECGYAFSNIDANAHTVSLSEKLQAISEECYAKDYSKPAKAKKHKFWDDDDDDDDDDEYYEDDKRANEINKRQSEVIKSFPIPTTKADLFELMSLLWPSAKKGRYDINSHVEFMGDWEYTCMLQDAYVSKYEECLTKIKILFPNDPLFASFIQEELKKQEAQSTKKRGLFGLLKR